MGGNRSGRREINHETHDNGRNQNRIAERISNMAGQKVDVQNIGAAQQVCNGLALVQARTRTIESDHWPVF